MTRLDSAHPPITPANIARDPPSRRPSVRFSSIAFGSISLVLAVLWCLGGAGIYGSPLAGMQSDELVRVLAFIALGPVIACVAPLLALQWPRAGSIMLIAGGVASGFFAMTVLWRDATTWPLVLMSMPMIALGWWSLREQARPRPTSVPSIGWTIVDILLFAAFMWATWALASLLLRYDPFGVGSAPLLYEPLLNHEWRQVSLVATLVVGALALLATIFRARLFNPRVCILAGVWWGVLLSLARTFQ